MEQLGKSRWENHEHWFKFDHLSGLKRFEQISTLSPTSTAIALRALKFHLEDKFGFEITDDLFCDIFTKVCNFSPVPALGGLAGLEFVQPLQRILEKHGVSKDYLGKVWSTFRVQVPNPRCYKNILLHIPHSSSTFPDSSGHSFIDLNEDERLLIDYYTDELFAPSQDSEHICSVKFPYCRLYCDVERLINDPLEKYGLGFHYSPFDTTSESLTRSFCNREESFNIYADFHSLVSKKLVELSDDTILIDCHSFSNLPNLLVSNPPHIDICIGYNDDETCPNKVVIGNVVRYFESLGYQVGINIPFSNSKTFNVPVKYHTLMIEVNKRLYMNEETMEKSDSFNKLKYDIQSLYSILLRP